MLIGEYRSSLGEKNRISLPRKLLTTLGRNIVLTRGYERSVILVDSSRWDTLIAEINKHPLLEMNVRDTKRFLLGGASSLMLDSQGRFVLPESLKTYAGIDKQIVLIGVGEWMEIWEQDKWDSKLEELAETSADLADRLSKVTDKG